MAQYGPAGVADSTKGRPTPPADDDDDDDDDDDLDLFGSDEEVGHGNHGNQAVYGEPVMISYHLSAESVMTSL